MAYFMLYLHLAVVALFLAAGFAAASERQSPYTAANCSKDTADHDALSLVQLRAQTSKAKAESTENGPMYVWVEMNKVGETSMQKLLSRRATRHGWKGDGAEIGTVCNTQGWAEERKESIECSSEPDGSVIAADYPGYCEQLNGARPCQYLTLLREPVDRMISEYVSLCLNCEVHSMCEISQEEKEWAKKHPDVVLPPECPAMSLSEYAFRHSNPYTRKFSKIDTKQLQQGDASSPGHDFFLTEEHFESAKKTLLSEDMTVMWFEDLLEDDGITHLSSLLKDNITLDEAITEDVTMEKESYNDFKVDKDTRTQLEMILKYDMDLYHLIQDKQLETQEHPTGPLVAWIMLGRVGSTTMWNILTQRAERHKWHVKRDETALLRGYKWDQNLCHWDKMLSEPQQKNLECSRQPDTSVVTTVFPGYCEALNGFRPCQYFTLLRDPVNRMISEFTHFCMHCGEKIMCEMPEEEKLWSARHPEVVLPQLCPEMGLMEYAFRHSNPYTRRFSMLDTKNLTQGEFSAVGHDYSLTEEHYKSALETLTSKKMTVLFIENFQEKGISTLSELLGEDMTGEASGVHENPSHDDPEITADERKALEKILEYDMRLVKALGIPEVK